MKIMNTFYRQGILTLLVIGLGLLSWAGCGVQPSQKRVYKIARQNPATPSQVSFRQGRQPQPQTRTDSPAQKKQLAAQPPVKPAPEKPAAPQPPRVKTQQSPEVGFTTSREYHIGPGDVLQVQIEQLLNPERTEKLRVAVDHNGEINLPVLNRVSVQGKTVDQVRETIISRLASEYIREPVVAVHIEEYQNKQVMVLGHVKRPGALRLQSDATTLLDVIADAGGLMENPSPEIEILRGAYDPSGRMGVQMFSVGEQNRTTRELVPISKLFAEEESGQVNPPIFAGDVVKVRSSNDGYFYIDGEVWQPGSKVFRQPMTILQAVTTAGGLTDVAADKKCKIIRRNSDGQEKEIIVNLNEIRKGKKDNFLVARNDTIYIPQDPGKAILDGIRQIFVRGTQAGVNMTYDATGNAGLPSRGY